MTRSWYFVNKKSYIEAEKKLNLIYVFSKMLSYTLNASTGFQKNFRLLKMYFNIFCAYRLHQYLLKAYFHRVELQLLI